MGLTSALNTSLNGLTLNETTLDVLGNNIANAGTNGFKASNVLFTTQLARTLSVGSRPNDSNGGTNPRQIGLGATTASITKDFSQGSITNSTSPSDLAIQGDGFFILKGADGTVYSRNGNFALNSESLLTNAQGLKVQGFGVDSDFNLITTQLTDIRIPLGELNVAQQTQNVTIGGALLPSGTLASQGSLLTSEELVDNSQVGNPDADGTTLLVDLATAADAATNLFADGETITYTPKKGSRTLEAASFTVTAAGTVAEFMAFMDAAIGIHSGGGIGGSPGVTISGGQIAIAGNFGSVNDLTYTVGDLLGAGGGTKGLTFNKTQSANGESAITDFIVYDSLGEQITLKMTSYLESQSGSQTVFRFFVESFDDSRGDTALSNGTITFDSLGNVVDTTGSTFSIERNDSAAVSPMQITLDLSNISGISSVSAGSTLSLVLQDGSGPGTLTNFVIDENGIINGVFDNGVIRTLGQVTLARFTNPQGLVEAGGGTFREGVGSGSPFLVTAGNFGAGTIRAGAIELSNTDIGRNLVDLIVASTNYRGNARVISAIQQLVDELLVLGR
ncbi:MAG: flagellar hook-basal body complex protein [Planctomycetaceae bacterium]